jgi:hypothetical protein
MTTNKPKPFFVLKVKTGETLFAEILTTNDTHIIMLKPLQIHYDVSEGMSDRMFATEWVPYTDDEQYPIPLSMIYYVGYLNDQFIKFYGSVLMQTEISKIKKEVVDNMADNSDYASMLDGVQQMKEVFDQMKDKYNLEEDSVDFSEFEKALDKHKENLVLH